MLKNLHISKKSCTFASQTQKIARKEAYMQAKLTKNNHSEQTRPMCSMDYALADIAAGRINHYDSLEELINKFK